MRGREKMDAEDPVPGLRAPLISTSGESRGAHAGGGGRGGEEGGGRGGEVLAEVQRQLWLAGPLMSVNLLQYSLNVISVMFVGHLGELALAGASMATSFAGVTGFSLLLGMGSAMDTFCGQAFGARQYHMLGVHMQRAMFVLTLVSIPLAFIWAYTGDILMALGQDPEISREAGLYARWMIPSLFAYGLLQCHVRFLQTQSVVFPMMLSSGITALLHVVTCWILVFKSGLGNKGAALANCISYWINVSILAIYVRISPSCKKTWTGFSKEALHDIFSFIKLAVPSAVMVCLEFWSFEFLVLLSGLLPNPTLETSVLSISLNSSALIFMVPLGLGNAVSTRVSNELGAGHPQAARLAVYAVVFMAIVEGLLVALVTVLVRGSWGYLYSSEEEVVKYVAIMLPVLAVSNFLDGIQCVLSGTIRGCGRQKIGALVNLGAFYIVGIPCAVLLAFVLHIGGKGLWMGIICGLVAQDLLLISITVCTDWDKEAEKSKDRVYSASIPVDMVS
uniref:Protein DETOXIFICATION n=1 Tax=Anthurium amnicola TaxID=1678845 RepID=A0A1D1Z036_9ARAE